MRSRRWPARRKCGLKAHRLRAYDLGVARPAVRPMTITPWVPEEQRDYDENQEKRRHHHERVDELAHESIDPAAPVTRRHAEQRTHDGGDDRRGEAHQQRNAAAVEYDREHVAPEAVRAQRMGGARRRDHIVRKRLRVVGRKHARRRRDEQEDHKHPKPRTEPAVAPDEQLYGLSPRAVRMGVRAPVAKEALALLRAFAGELEVPVFVELCDFIVRSCHGYTPVSSWWRARCAGRARHRARR